MPQKASLAVAVQVRETAEEQIESMEIQIRDISGRYLDFH